MNLFINDRILIFLLKVSSSYHPAVGLRLYLEGPKSNQLAIHIQHLSSLPSMFTSVTTSRFSMWQSSEDSGNQFFEPIRWKSCSHVCSAAVKHNNKWFDIVSDGVFIVTGAQLMTNGRWLKKCLHLRLLFSHIPNCSVQKTEWTKAPSHSHKGSFFTSFSTALSSTFTHHESHCLQRQKSATLDSAVFDNGPPVPVHSQKLLRYVDMTEIVRGPNNIPGHWLVTGAKLVKEGGKIGLHVKFALLNYFEQDGMIL